MKSKVLLSSLAVLLVGAFSTATFALFSAGRSATQSFTAGSVCISAKRDNGQPVPGPMFYVTQAQGATPGGTLPPNGWTGEWAPGDHHTRTLIVENQCNLDAWLKSIKAQVTAGDASLAGALQVDVTASNSPGGPEEPVASGTLATFLAGNVNIVPNGNPANRLIAWAPGGTVYLNFKVTMPLATGNAFQGKSLVATFTVNAEQNKNNP
jgi:hypothetical protein